MACWRRIPSKYITGVETSHRVIEFTQCKHPSCSGPPAPDSSHNSGLTSRDMQGSPEEVWVAWRKDSGGGHGEVGTCQNASQTSMCIRYNRLCILNIYIAYYDIHFVCGNTHLHLHSALCASITENVAYCLPFVICYEWLCNCTKCVKMCIHVCMHTNQAWTGHFVRTYTSFSVLGCFKLQKLQWLIPGEKLQHEQMSHNESTWQERAPFMQIQEHQSFLQTSHDWPKGIPGIPMTVPNPTHNRNNMWKHPRRRSWPRIVGVRGSAEPMYDQITQGHSSGQHLLKQRDEHGKKSERWPWRW